jgi:hypothetical protein
MGYAIGQARKYGVKGSRLGCLKRIKEYMDKVDVYRITLTLGDISEDLLKQCGDESLCFHKQEDNKGTVTDYLYVCSSKHQYNIPLKEFKDRIVKNIDNYGDRTKKALEDNNIDYKALSQAVRVLYQCEQLYSEGTIKFPLKDKSLILQIKQGELSWEEIEIIILQKLQDVDKLRNDCKLNWNYNKKFCTELVRELYEMGL